MPKPSPSTPHHDLIHILNLRDLSFLTLSCHLTPNILLRALFSNLQNLLDIVSLSYHDSCPQSNTDLTKLIYKPDFCV